MKKSTWCWIFACLLLAVPILATGLGPISQDVGGGKKGGAMFFVELWQDADIFEEKLLRCHQWGGNKIDCDPKIKLRSIWGTVLGTQREVQFSRITVSAWVAQGSE